MRINCILCIKQERRTKSKEVVWVRVKKRNKCQHQVVNVRGLCEKQTNVTQWWMLPGQCQIVVLAWWKRYCTAGARKLPYLAARTVRAYDTVLTHRQYKKSNHQIHHGEITAEPNHQQWQNYNWTLTRNKREAGGRNEAKKEERR